MSKAKFSIDNYKRIIESFRKEGYEIVPLDNNFFEIKEKYSKIIFIRHDIDYNLKAGRLFSEIDKELGIKSCFCLRVHTQVYNLLSKEGLEFIKSIKSNRHIVGLHFEILNRVKMVDRNIVVSSIKRDTKLLEDITGIKRIRVFSWHNVSVLDDDMKHLVYESYLPYINAYSLTSYGIKYYSDSNHRYSVEEWLFLSKKAPDKLHLLFHPFQWIHNSSSMREVLANEWENFIKKFEDENLISNHIFKKLFPDGYEKVRYEEFLRPLLSKEKRRI